MLRVYLEKKDAVYLAATEEAMEPAAPVTRNLEQPAAPARFAKKRAGAVHFAD